MSTASALFAPAAPVSTGPSAAAPGAEAVDAGLFSSKIADALNAGVHGAPVERMTPGRLTDARSLGVIMAQPMTAELDADTPTATTDTIPTTTGESADSETQLVLSEQQIGPDTAAKDDDTPGLVVATPFTAAQPTPAVPVAQSLDVASSPAASEDAAESPVDPQAPKDVASVAFVAAGAMPTTVATNPPAATDTAAKTASAPANQDLEAKPALATATAQAVLSELSEILTTEASTSSPAVAKPAEVEAAEASVMPTQLTTTDGPKPTVTPKPAVTVKGDAAPRPTDAATPAPATSESAASTIQTAVATPDKPAAPSPITQSLAAAQIPTAQVQITVASTMPKLSIIVPADVVAAITEAASSVTAETADTPDKLAEAPAPSDTPKSSPTALQPAPPFEATSMR